MGIRCNCPDCDRKLHLKSYLAGKTGVCPHCQVRFTIPLASTRASSKQLATRQTNPADHSAGEPGSVIIQSEPAENVGNGAAARRNQSAKPSVQASDQVLAPSVSAASAQSGAPPTDAPNAAANHAAVAPSPQPAEPQPADGVHVSAAYPTQTTPAFAPPLAEAPEANWYVRPPTGGQFGPAKGELMQKWLDTGRVASDAFVWREGWPDWRRAAEVFSVLGGFSPPAPAHAVREEPRPNQSATTRPRKSNAFAISAIVVLVLASIGLLAALFYLMRNQL